MTAGPALGDIVELVIEKPAAGGRMLARLDGEVVLVAGVIPGERVAVRIDERRGGVRFGSAVDVLDASPDRRMPGADPACGGRHFAHIAYPRQVLLKQEIMRDAFRRIAHVDLPGELSVLPSPEDGYRMRARLHARGTRLGFYREGTHELCDPACSGQLHASSLAALERLSAALKAARLDDVRAVELAENCDLSERVCVIELSAEGRTDVAPDTLSSVEGVTGITIARAGRALQVRGADTVADTVQLALADGRSGSLRLERHVSGFFQSNRHLLERLIHRVLVHVPSGPLTDLYAGSGLFGLAHAATGRGDVVAVESDAISASDLRRNAEPFGRAVATRFESVEDAVRDARVLAGRTVLVDPPRVGLSKSVTGALTEARPQRILYVSCDIATLARDVSRLAIAGYTVTHAEIFDLFPGTAHVESLVVLEIPH